MDQMQELRGEIRQLLNDTLVFAAANAATYREVLELIAKVDD